MARFFPKGAVRLRRFVFRLAAAPVLRELVFLAYRLTGRSGYLPWMRACCRRLPVDELARRLTGGAGA